MFRFDKKMPYKIIYLLNIKNISKKDPNFKNRIRGSGSGSEKNGLDPSRTGIPLDQDTQNL